MASIFKTLDDLVTNVSEKINKDKWDRSALNPALLEAANEAEEKAKEEERLKHFQSQLENRSLPVAAGAETVGNINTVVCAEAPVSTAPASDPNTTYAGFSDMEMLLTPPDLPVKPVKFVKTEPKEEPVAKGPVAIAPVPTVPVKEKPSVKDEAYIKPVFKSRFSGPKKQQEVIPTAEITPETTPETTPVAEAIPTYGAHPTIPLSDLPVIDPSQSLSAMMKKEEEEAQPLTTTILAHTSAIEMSEEQPVEKQIEEQPVIEEQKEEMPSVPVYAAPEEPNITPEPVGLQGLYGTVPETVEERTAEQQLHAVEKPVDVAIEPAAGKPVEQPVEKPQEEVTVKTEAASPVVEDKTSPCYYILIKHTKTYPEKGSLVMMRSCDHEYAWTNKQDESEKPTYDICPGCGKPISYTSTEID